MLTSIDSRKEPEPWQHPRYRHARVFQQGLSELHKEGQMTTGHRLFGKEFVGFNTVPCRHICPYLCASEALAGAPLVSGLRDGAGQIHIYIYIEREREIINDINIATTNNNATINTHIYNLGRRCGLPGRRGAVCPGPGQGSEGGG